MLPMKEVKMAVITDFVRETLVVNILLIAISKICLLNGF